MASALLAAALLAIGEPAAPVAPVAPEPPKIEAPASHSPLPSPSTSNATSSTAPALTGQVSKRRGMIDSPGAPFAKAPPPIDHHPPPEPLLDLPTARHAGAAEVGSTTPPSLAPGALRDELAGSARRRQEELQALARERARLEKLAAEIAAARAALREETARLEERARKGEGERAEAARKAAEAKASTPGRAPPKPGEKPPVDAVAKALKGMKSEPAAVLLARLERPLAVEVLRRMRPADAGALLEKMKPEAAAELLSALADDQRGVSR